MSDRILEQTLTETPSCGVARCAGSAVAFLSGSEMFIGQPLGHAFVRLCRSHMVAVMDGSSLRRDLARLDELD